jgi:2,3-bisphosphoglycerate-dependent phosphoglycerate mutase
MMKEIFLIRHAESPYESGVPDAARPLSLRGRHQAEALVAELELLGIEEIHCSPYERCRHTIAPLSSRLGLEPKIVHDLRERTFTAAHVEDWAGTWHKAWHDPDFTFNDGESGRQAQARIHAALREVLAMSTARKLAVSSHGNVIALLLQQIDSDFGFEHACAIRNPDVFRVTYDGVSLAWDRGFSIAGLAAFATSFASRTEE